MVIVDTGPLVAAAIRTDPDHERCSALFEEGSTPFVVPQLVVAEAAYLVGRRLGAVAEAGLLRNLAVSPLSFTSFEQIDLERAADLIESYADLRLGAVDAIVIAIAERLGVRQIATLDHRHFTVVRPLHVEAFELVP